MSIKRIIYSSLIYLSLTSEVTVVSLARSSCLPDQVVHCNLCLLLCSVCEASLTNYFKLSAI